MAGLSLLLSALLSTGGETAAGRAGAQVAQGLYAVGKYEAAAEAYRKAAEGVSQELHDTLLFNAACADFRAGKYKEAAEALQGLAQHEGPGQPASASYNLGCALYRDAEAAPGTNESAAAATERRAALLNESSLAFQRAMRTERADSDARRNFAVIAGAVPEAEEKAKVARLMARYAKTPPADLAYEIHQGQREILKGIPIALTNNSPAQIAELETLAARQGENADRLIPLRAKMAAGNPQQAPQHPAAAPQMDSLQNDMRTAAARLRDLDEIGYAGAADAANAVYGLWKSIAPSTLVLKEDLYRQTNAITLTRPMLSAVKDSSLATLKAEQKECAELTRLFSDRFSQEVPVGGTPVPASVPPSGSASGGTNAPAAGGTNEQAITAETRAKILELAMEAEATQRKALDHAERKEMTPSLQEQRRSYELLKKIEELLPKQKNQQNQEQKQEQQDQKQDQEQEQPQEEQPQPQQKPEENQPEKDKKQMDEERAMLLLEKALQREKDYRDEKQRREIYIPPSQTARDW